METRQPSTVRTLLPQERQAALNGCYGREASRAGACPAGVRVSRNATSAVVSAELKFFP